MKSKYIKPEFTLVDMRGDDVLLVSGESGLNELPADQFGFETDIFGGFE